MLVSTARRLVATIESLGPALTEQTDAELKKGYLSLRYRAKSGELLDRLLPECFALVREAGRRHLVEAGYPIGLLGESCHSVAGQPLGPASHGLRASSQSALRQRVAAEQEGKCSVSMHVFNQCCGKLAALAVQRANLVSVYTSYWCDEELPF